MINCPTCKTEDLRLLDKSENLYKCVKCKGIFLIKVIKIGVVE